MSRASKLRIFLGVSAGVVGAAFLMPRMAQPQSYHHFADQRALLGLSNFADVISNVAFLAAGLYGIAVTLRRHGAFRDRREAAAWLVLFAGLALTAFGSAYYHLRPNNERLVWDRLPMTVGFMGLFAAVLEERISVEVGHRLLPFLLAAGAASVEYWIWTEHQLRGDLRPYALVQFYPLIAILLLLWFFAPRYTRGYDYLIAVGFYAAAKVFEVADNPVFALTDHVVSGHTLKHIAAGIGGYWVARMIARRAPLSAPAAAFAGGHHMAR